MKSVIGLGLATAAGLLRTGRPKAKSQRLCNLDTFATKPQLAQENDLFILKVGYSQNIVQFYLGIPSKDWLCTKQYLLCIAFIMMVLSITRTLVLIILWSTILEVHAKSPHRTTLCVNIGQLYPRADFAGVLITLNINKAINRGKSALNLTNLSSYTTSKTNYGQMLWGQQKHTFPCPQTYYRPL